MLTLPVLMAALAALADTTLAAGVIHVGPPCEPAEGVACTLQAAGVRDHGGVVDGCISGPRSKTPYDGWFFWQASSTE